MSFDEVLFPVANKYGAQVASIFSTDVVSLASGFEKRNQNWAMPKRRYMLKSGTMPIAEAELLHAFFLARAGRARGFRFRDWSDYRSASVVTAFDQELGTGDGVCQSFQLSKTYQIGEDSVRRIIVKPVDTSVKVAVNGVVWLSGWSVDLITGMVTFDEPPQSGAVLSAGFMFDVPVRFDVDEILFTEHEKNVRFTDVSLIEVRVL